MITHAPIALFISHLPDLDWLSAIRFGDVDDEVGPERWRAIADDAAYLLDFDARGVIGFRVQHWSGVDPEADAFSAAWDAEGPRFDAPTLGLRDVCAGEVMMAARSLIGRDATPNRTYFQTASTIEYAELREWSWRMCLHSGDCMAHYGLGIELHDTGRFHDAYRHLRFYAEIAPRNAWAHCWHGTAAASIGEHAEARHAYQRAIVLEQDGADPTDAAKLLAALPDAKDATSRRRAEP